MSGSDNLEGDYVDHPDKMVCLQHIFLVNKLVKIIVFVLFRFSLDKLQYD